MPGFRIVQCIVCDAKIASKEMPYHMSCCGRSECGCHFYMCTAACYEVWKKEDMRERLLEILC